MGIWSSVTNAVGGALKSVGDVFGGDSNQSIAGRIGKGVSAAYDIGIKAPTDLLGVGSHLGASGFQGFANLDQRAYTDLISHPLADVVNMQSKAMYALGQGQGIAGAYRAVTTHQNWIDSWENSAHFSPGQEIALSANNTIAGLHREMGPLGGALGGAQFGALGAIAGEGATQHMGASVINPSDPNAVAHFVGQGSWGMRIMTGATDGVLRTYLDPSQKVLKWTSLPLKALKNNPIKSPGDIDKALATARSQRLVNWVVGKDASTIAEHPAFRNSAFRYSIATALAGAKDTNESELLLRTLMGDKGAFDRLSSVNSGLAFRNANLLAPPEAMEKFALAPGDAGLLEKWLQPVEKTKAAAAQAQLLNKADAYTNILDAAQSMRARTTSYGINEAFAGLRASAKYSTLRDVQALPSGQDLLHPQRLVSYMQDHLHNTPVRVYHALTDKPPMGIISHGEDGAVDQVRSWLNKSKVLTPDEKQDFAKQYAGMNRGDRSAGWDKIEEQVYQKVADAHGIHPDDMTGILNETRSRQGAYAEGAKSGAYGVLKTPDGDAVHLLATGDGEIVAAPDLITQLQQGAVPMTNLVDIERAIKRMNDAGLIATANKMGSASSRFLVDKLDKVYGVWKPLSLMSMHRAYNHIGDDYLRATAKLGGMTMASNAVEGAGNFIENRLARFTNAKWMANREGQYQQMVDTARSQFHGLMAQSKDQLARIGAGEAIPAENRVQAAEVRAAHARYMDLRDNKPVFTRTRSKIGDGTSMVPGTNIRVEDAFGGPNSDWMRHMSSSEQFFQSYMNDTAHNMYQYGLNNQVSRGFTVIRPADNLDTWSRAYLHYVNNQLRPDPVAKKLLGGSDPADVERWLSSSPEGQSYMRQLHKADTWSQVQAVQDHIDKYLPDNTPVRNAIAPKSTTGKSRMVKTADINKTWKSASQMPEVNGNLNLAMHGGSAIDKSFQFTVKKLLKFTGTLPDDAMVRHPVFNEMYKGHRNSLIKDWIDQSPGGKISMDDLGRITSTATKMARKDLQSLVYDTSRFNDAGHLLRFISPFFNAWFNALSSWSRLFYENPDLLAKTAVAKNGIWNNPLMVDTSTGQKAKPDTPLSNLALVAHLPKPVAGMLGSSQLNYLAIDGKTLVSPTYADSLGNPGFGPIVAVPVNELAKKSPGVAENPLTAVILGGRITPNSLQSFIPSAVNQMLNVPAAAVGAPDLFGNNAEDQLGRSQLAWSIYQEQMYDYQSGHRSNPPNMQDALNQAGHASLIDTIVNRLAPLGFKPRAESQFYVDQYHSFLDQDPKNAQQNFVNKYGEGAYVFTQSLDKNNAGIPATAGAINAYKQYQGLISQYPELGALIVGPLGSGNYDSMAYQWEVANGLRTKLSPQEAAKQAAVGQGWQEYTKISSAISYMLAARGLKSVNQAGASDLKQLKSAYATAANTPDSQYYNPDWYAAYTGYNQGSYDQRIQAMEKVAQDPALIANPVRTDIRALNQYFQARSVAKAYLAGRPSQSLSAKANSDVANWFDYEVASIAQDNTQFATIWERYLKKDDLKFS